MNILLESIQKIPGILVYSIEEGEDQDIVTCKYNWVVDEDKAKDFIYIPATAFRGVKWTKDSHGNDLASFFWQKSNVPIRIETKLNQGYVVDKMRFSIEFDLKLNLPSRPEDINDVKNIVSNFEKMRYGIEHSLLTSSPPTGPIV